MPLLQSRLYKNKIFCIFPNQNLHISQNCSIFASDFKNATKLQQIFNINK